MDFLESTRAGIAILTTFLFIGIIASHTYDYYLDHSEARHYVTATAEVDTVPSRQQMTLINGLNDFKQYDLVALAPRIVEGK